MSLLAVFTRQRSFTNQNLGKGLLAYTAFGSRLLRMDYKNHRVQISDPTRQDKRCSNDCGTISNATFGKQGPPMLVSTGFAVNGRPLTVQIDTLFEGSMLIYPTAVDKLRLVDSAKIGNAPHVRLPPTSFLDKLIPLAVHFTAAFLESSGPFRRRYPRARSAVPRGCPARG